MEGYRKQERRKKAGREEERREGVENVWEDE